MVLVCWDQQRILHPGIVVLLRDCSVDAHADFPGLGGLDVGNGRFAPT